MRASSAAVAEPRAVPAGEGMRVAWFGHGHGGRADGLSSYSRELIRGLRARGAVVRFFCHAQDGETDGDAVQLQAWRCKTITASRPGSLRRIEAELGRFRPDVVHTSWSFSQLDGAIARSAHRAGAAAVATFHLPYAPPGSIRGRVLEGLYRVHRRNLLEYDRVIALSDDQRALLEATGFPGDRVEVVHNAVDTDAFTPGPSRLRERLGARFVVVYLGRLDPEKRVGALVDSFVARGFPDDHVLLIAGAGNQARRLERRCAGLANVRLLGMLTSVAERVDLLRAADVFVLPSTAEGLALSLLEAMATGRAVIATEAGEDGAALAGCGITLPVRPLEPALGDALDLLASHPALRCRLGEAARRRAVERYAMRVHLDRVTSVYAAVTSAGRVTATA